LLNAVDFASAFSAAFFGSGGTAGTVSAFGAAAFGSGGGAAAYFAFGRGAAAAGVVGVAASAAATDICAATWRSAFP
jgi:hypothetical protein